MSFGGPVVSGPYQAPRFWEPQRYNLLIFLIKIGGGGGNRAPLGVLLTPRSAPVFFASGGFLPPLPRLARRSKAVRFQHCNIFKKQGDGRGTIPCFLKMVEAVGIEPTSGNASIQSSTYLACSQSRVQAPCGQAACPPVRLSLANRSFGPSPVGHPANGRPIGPAGKSPSDAGRLSG